MENLRIFYGLAFIIVVIVIIVLWKVVIKKERFTAHYKESREYNKPIQELIELVSRTLNTINAKNIKHNTDNSIFEAKIGFSIWSWSEKLEIKIESSGQDSIVKFSSQCSLATQAIDWGKNHRNSKKFYKKLEKELMPTR